METPGAIEHGKVTCKDNYCMTKCDPSYDGYNGQPKAKCKQLGPKKWAWTNKLGECKTCAPLKVNSEEINVSIHI